jgi:hypothetical protein
VLASRMQSAASSGVLMLIPPAPRIFDQASDPLEVEKMPPEEGRPAPIDRFERATTLPGTIIDSPDDVRKC